MNCALTAALVLALVAVPAAADWRGFYTPSERPSAAAAPDTACLREILAAQERHGIPGNLLLAIGLQEAGQRRDGVLTVWPYTVNANGEGRFFDSAEAAADWVRERQAAGIASIDLGCMQINLRWHPGAFATVEQGFDPAINVEYAALLLKALEARLGDWGAAAGAYHSQTPEYQNAYLERLARNVEVANQRIEEIRTLAGRTAPAARAPTMPQSGVFWTAWLGSGDGSGVAAEGDGARSLFGAGPIEPILPAFRSVPEEAG